ncbi:MAG TPA: hypothetical protein VHV31_08235 [Nitrolancea sp.]|nr:hypothetical protein [Nitrolancea sp.]
MWQVVSGEKHYPRAIVEKNSGSGMLLVKSGGGVVAGFRWCGQFRGVRRTPWAGIDLEER